MPTSPRMRLLVGWLFGAALFAGCGADSSDDTGGLALQLELANGVEIDEVSYVISGDGDTEDNFRLIEVSEKGKSGNSAQ